MQVLMSFGIGCRTAPITPARRCSMPRRLLSRRECCRIGLDDRDGVTEFAPKTRGHGVPEVMDAIYYGKSVIRPAIAAIKALA